MFEQMRAAVFARVGDGWVGEVVLAMAEIGSEMTLAGLYAGFADEEESAST